MASLLVFNLLVLREKKNQDQELWLTWLGTAVMSCLKQPCSLGSLSQQTTDIMEATLPPRAMALFELNMFTALQDPHKDNWPPMSSPPALNEKQLSKNPTAEEVSLIEMSPDFATIKMPPEITMFNHPAGENESVCQTKSGFPVIVTKTNLLFILLVRSLLLPSTIFWRVLGKTSETNF